MLDCSEKKYTNWGKHTDFLFYVFLKQKQFTTSLLKRVTGACFGFRLNLI